jgi:hypothetical protein
MMSAEYTSGWVTQFTHNGSRGSTCRIVLLSAPRHGLSYAVASCRCSMASRLRAAPDEGRDEHGDEEGDDERKQAEQHTADDDAEARGVRILRGGDGDDDVEDQGDDTGNGARDERPGCTSATHVGHSPLLKPHRGRDAP